MNFTEAQFNEVRDFVKGLHTWFNVYRQDGQDGTILIDTRENGDVGEETPGQADILEARRLLKELRGKFYPQYKFAPDCVDEWVMIFVTIRE